MVRADRTSLSRCVDRTIILSSGLYIITLRTMKGKSLFQFSAPHKKHTLRKVKNGFSNREQTTIDSCIIKLMLGKFAIL